jgi:N-acetylglutamate synthase-like GNAT family acetyltransferase
MSEFNKIIAECGLTHEDIVNQAIRLNYNYMKQGLMGPIFGNRNGIRTSLKAGRLLYIVEGNILIGFLLWNILKRTNILDIRKIAIDPNYTKKGYGINLFNQVKKIAEDNEVKFIRAKVSKINKSSHGWYNKLGFFEVDEGDNTVTFIKELTEIKYNRTDEVDISEIVSFPKENKAKIEWVLDKDEPEEFKSINKFFDDELIKYKNDEITPWIFNNDINLFKKQYNRLCNGLITKSNRMIYCLDAMEYYHRHLWFMNNKASILEWQNNREKVIDNRLRYVDLDPRSIRRFFKICYMVPNLFQDGTARYMASLINGNIIYDPFAGFGGRMLGSSSLNKKYIGTDFNKLTVNANKLIIRDLELKDVEVNYGDSSKIKIECNGLITSPPFYNKDKYSNSEFKSLNEYKEFINAVFSNIIVHDKAIIDFKAYEKCSYDDFKSALPYKHIEEIEVKFGGMTRNGKDNQSKHIWYVCNN